MAVSWAILLILAATPSLAEPLPCSLAEGERAMAAAADLVQRLGVAGARAAMTAEEATIHCGGHDVKAMDLQARWLISPDDPSLVGRAVESFGDGAATNFMKAMIAAAVAGKGALGQYVTHDTGRDGARVDKVLFYRHLSSQGVVLYGAFILR
ncbi:hypothetical protein A6A04_03010 [Paramagnetospirillum marisnigri]|uniref:Chemotaxis protein n=1 Tax=Paramagnetospirillum marisnigri TaxID=1285242 RepID=A0A178MM10_9PROT|nr:hypothetical protein [Paramagnetospirillum marisnigri]OAN49105.1 hypothetical protein A6A04_03010 [Paramagnetospirillum marisnigri]